MRAAYLWAVRLKYYTRDDELWYQTLYACMELRNDTLAVLYGFWCYSSEACGIGVCAHQHVTLLYLFVRSTRARM